jgi:hypothetical protein
MWAIIENEGKIRQAQQRLKKLRVPVQYTTRATFRRV